MIFWEPQFNLDDDDIWYGTFIAEDAEGDAFEISMFMLDEEDYLLKIHCESFAYFNLQGYEMKKLYETIEKTRRELMRIENAWFAFDYDD